MLKFIIIVIRVFLKLGTKNLVSPYLHEDVAMTVYFRSHYISGSIKIAKLIQRGTVFFLCF